MSSVLSFKSQTAVRLKSNSALLFIDAIDEENAIAFCRTFGDSGPKGEAQPYPLDALRENVLRTSQRADTQQDKASLARILCYVGLHRWQARVFRNRSPLGDIDALACTCCGNFRILD